MPLSAGTKLGHYEVISLLGKVGMGVWKARDTTLKREAALKFLPAAFLRDPDRMARFQRQAEALTSLDHPNFGPIYGLVDSADSRAPVLALNEGLTLADRIDAGPLLLEEAGAILTQIIEGLQSTH
jgi:eukaryotic-like serine/threonine-protein kinase